jgi:hypothetical protein
VHARWQVLDPAIGALDWQGQLCRLSTARAVRVLVSALCCQQQLAQNIQDTSCVAAVGPVGGRGRLDTESHQGMVKQPIHDNRDGPPAAAEAIQPSFFLLAHVSCRFTHHKVYSQQVRPASIPGLTRPRNEVPVVLFLSELCHLLSLTAQHWLATLQSMWDLPGCQPACALAVRMLDS